MSHGQFFVSDTNPNDSSGGGGCICSPEKQIDCKGPYILVPGNDMESVVSPHVVIGAPCAARMVQLLAGEALSSGEHHELQQHFSSGPAAVSRGDLPTPVIEIPPEDVEDIPEV